MDDTNRPRASAIRLQPLSGGDPTELGAYRLMGRLASGGMGRVYLGRSIPDGDLVAVKTLLAQGRVGDVDRRRFAREVKVAQRVRSDHTARVLAADPEAERPWMAIRYIAAPSLAELRSTGPAGAPCVRWIAEGSAAVLLGLHAEGIVHRDLKPQNILLPASGVRLIDFGISHATDLTRTQLTLGTIAFTSPEQARGEPSTTASDVYSLGATLFHLAVGRPPYADTRDALRLLAQVARGRLDPSGLPSELSELILPCLAIDPADRPLPVDLLGGFTEPATLPTGGRWLPAGWARLIDAYEREGRELAANDPPVAGDPTPTAPSPAVTVPVTSAPTRVTPAPTRVAPIPSESVRRVAGLSSTGWKAAGSAAFNLTVLVLFGLGLLAVVGMVVAIVIAIVVT